MACNPVTFLKEINGCPQDTCNYSSILGALGYSAVGDCLQYEHWLMLENACKNLDYITLKKVVYEILPYYVMVYGYLGKPERAELWQHALYMEGRKSTMRRKTIQKMYEAYQNYLHEAGEVQE